MIWALVAAVLLLRRGDRASWLAEPWPEAKLGDEACMLPIHDAQCDAVGRLASWSLCTQDDFLVTGGQLRGCG